MSIYLRPASLQNALAALAERPLTVLAGGTDFYPARVGRAVEEDVLDITAVAELAGIEETAAHWRIGACVTWSALRAAPLPEWFACLKLAAREVGGVQIQNTATVAGNLCNASPAADGVPPLLALDADVELRSAAGVRVLPLGEFVSGNRRTERTPHELVAAVRVPKRDETARSTFLKLGTRKYLVISIAMAAVAIDLAPDGTIARAGVAIGACSPVARRLADLERDLVGRPLACGIGRTVNENHLAPLAPITDVRGTADYRRDAVVTLVGRALEQLVHE